MNLDALISEYLEEHSHYKPAETYSRYKDGRIMSEGMEREFKDAEIFAKAALSYVDDPEVEVAEKMKIARKLEGFESPEKRRLLNIWRNGWYRGQNFN